MTTLQKLGRLVVSVEAETASFSTKMRKTSKQLYEARKRARETQRAFDKLQSAFNKASIGIAGLSTAYLALARNAINSIQKTYETARAYGIAESSVLSLERSLVSLGGKQENAEKVFKQLSTSLNSLEQNSITTKSAFDKLGLTYNQLSQLRIDEAFNLITQRLAGVSDATDRSRIALQIFSRTMQNVSFADFHSDFEKNLNYFTSKADKLNYLGKVAETVDLVLLDLKTAFSLVFAELAKNLPVGFSQDNINRIELMEMAIREVGKALLILMGIITANILFTAFTNFIALIGVATVAVKALGVALTFGWVGGLLGKLNKIKKGFGEVTTGADKLQKRVELIQKGIKGTTIGGGVAIGVGILGGASWDYVDKKLDELQKKWNAGEGQLTTLWDVINGDDADKKLTKIKNKGNSLFQVNEDGGVDSNGESKIPPKKPDESFARSVQGRFAELQKQQEIGYDGTDLQVKKMEEFRILQNYETQLQELREQGFEKERELNLQKKLESIKNMEQETLEYNHKKKMDDLKVQSETNMRKALMGLLSLASGKSKALFRINQAFGIADAIISANVASAKALATIPPPANVAMAKAIKIQALANVAMIASQKYQGRQTGGMVNAGQPYMVGEAGREMFIPSQRGHILSNSQTERRLGGATSINVNIESGASFDDGVLMAIKDNLSEIAIQIQNEQRRFV